MSKEEVISYYTNTNSIIKEKCLKTLPEDRQHVRAGDSLFHLFTYEIIVHN